MTKGKGKSPSTGTVSDRLEEVVDLALSIATAKGWDAEIDSLDKEGGRFASISVERSFAYDRTVTGNLDFSLQNKGLKLRMESTSFYSNGLSDLRDSVWAAVSELPWLAKSSTPKPAPPADIEIVSRLLRRFHRSARQLRHRYGDREPLRINDEYDAQDFLHALLRALFDDIRAEEYTPSYAGGASRIDFLLKSEGIAIEVKMASPSLRDKKVGEQLLIDIQRYQAHPNTKVLFCLVYDPQGEIRNPAGLEADLTKTHDKLDVRVIVVSPG